MGKTMLEAGNHAGVKVDTRSCADMKMGMHNLWTRPQLECDAIYASPALLA